MRYNLLLLMLYLPAYTGAQAKHDHIWLFGYTSDNNRAMLDFKNGSLEITEFASSIDFDPTNTSMASKEGNLLFSSNGCHIVNADHEIMENGDTINPGLMQQIYCPAGGIIWPQGVLALPMPESDSLYWVFNLNMEDVYPPP